MKYLFDNIKFNNRLVLKKGSFEANLGEITVITGPSGSGKSSLFRYLLKTKYFRKALNKCNGEVSVNGQVPTFVNNLKIEDHFDLIKDLSKQKKILLQPCSYLMLISYFS